MSRRFKIYFILLLVFSQPGCFGAASAAVTLKSANNSGLTGYWSFDEGKGLKAADRSGSGNTGTLQNGPAWTSGIRGKALQFSSAGSTGVVVNNPFSANDFTISLWMKPTLIDGSYHGFIGRNQGAGGWTYRAPGMWVEGSGGLHYDSYDTGGVRYSDILPNFFAQNQWVQATWIKNGASYLIYKNGALVYSTSTAPSALYRSGTDYFIGQVDNYFQGILDEVRVYNRALSAAEVSALYQAGGVLKINQPAAGNSASGLKGEYYSGMAFNTPLLSRVDSTVNYDWGTGSPDVRVPVDQFSTRWTGYVKADFSETYTFYATSDDGVRLWVNGQNLVNSWIDQAPTEHSGTITLTAGKWYPLTLEYYENGGGAVISLSYSSASTSKQIIPVAKLAYSLAAVTVNASQNSRNASGLAGFWSMNGKDTAAASAADVSGNGNSCGFVGGVAKAPGKVGQALKFDGSTGYLNCGNNSSLNLTNNFSISVWINPSGFAYLGGIVSKYQSPSANSFLLRLSESAPYNKLNFGGSAGINSNSALSANRWYHVVAVDAGGTGYIYINGVLDSSGGVSVSSSSDSVMIGVDYLPSARYFKGSIDEVRIYNRVLSADEISQLYALGR